MGQQSTKLEKINDDIYYAWKQKDDELHNLRSENARLKEELVMVKTVSNNNMDSDKLKPIKEQKDYECLVFSGGGIKCISLVGALQEYVDRGLNMNKIKKFAGTSAGAITASLLAIGYSIEELKEELFELPMSKIIDDKFGYIRDAFHFVKHYGIAPGDSIDEILADLITEKTGNPNYTIRNLYEDKGIELVIVVTDMCRESNIYFHPNHKDKQYRNISIKKAVRMSMNIPFLLEPVEFDNSYCVDGGVLDNYPLHVFDGEFPGDMTAIQNLCPINYKVLGFNILTKKEMENFVYGEKNKIDGIFDFSMTFINMLMDFNEKKMMTPSYWYRTVNIVTDNYPLTEFKLTDEQKEKLIEDGIKGVRKYLANS